jgi:hypothetical protein
MAERTDFERRTLAAVDDALRTYPLAEAPADLRRAVLARVRALSATELPRFRVAWLDVAISAFGAGMILVLFLAWRLLPLPLAREMVLRLQLETLFLAQHLPLPELLPPLVLGGALAVIALSLAAAFLGAPRPAPGR